MYIQQGTEHLINPTPFQQPVVISRESAAMAPAKEHQSTQVVLSQVVSEAGNSTTLLPVALKAGRVLKQVQVRKKEGDV